MEIQKAYLVKKTFDRAEMEEGKVELVLWPQKERVSNGFKPDDENAPYFHPEMSFWVGHDDERLYVYLRCYEKDPVVTSLKRNDDVCDDSCMEFFITPFEGAGYFNFETNAHPTLLLYYGMDRDHREPVSGDKWPDEAFHLKSEQGLDERGAFWQISYQIPFAFLKEETGFDEELKSGKIIYANVYQCGCNGQPCHYTTWMPIDTAKHPKPDYHRPEYFAPMILE